MFYDTRNLAPGFIWQEHDKVRVKEKDHAVAIFLPLEGPPTQRNNGNQLPAELAVWTLVLQAYRDQQWAQCER